MGLFDRLAANRLQRQVDESQAIAAWAKDQSSRVRYGDEWDASIDELARELVDEFANPSEPVLNAAIMALANLARGTYDSTARTIVSRAIKLRR